MMHVRGCICDDCTNPNVDNTPAEPVFEVDLRKTNHSMGPPVAHHVPGFSGPISKREQNARAYQKRKLAP
jgi:hypothetical protein